MVQATPLLGARDLRRSFGDKAVLDGVTFTIDSGQKIGLVGINGSGKSTLVRLIAGRDEPDGGELTRARDLELAVLDQEPTFAAGATPVEAVLAGLSGWREAVAAHERVSVQLAVGQGDAAARADRQAVAAGEVERLGGWNLEHEARAVLSHLGVGDALLDRDVSTLSGGERRRVALARLLVARPTLAILDEPTNHLDIEAIAWLETYLAETFAGALLLVTHDRHLLDAVTDTTFELERGALHAYDGGWATYLEAKALRQAHAERVEANRQNFLRRELEWLRRQPKARSTKQKARIGRAEAAQSAQGPAHERAAEIGVGEARAGKTLIDAREVEVGIGGRRLCGPLTAMLRSGERIGIIGPNGAGKTTVIRTLLGELEPFAGEVVQGATLQVAYLDQTRTGLDPEMSIYDAVGEGAHRANWGAEDIDLRSYLERFLFAASTQRQVVGSLSGGERARAALARVLRLSANVIVLDEPTNDLDVTTLASLEEALLGFGGAVLLVSHDRWLLDRVATSLWVLDGKGRLEVHAGGYSDYEARRRAQRQASGTSPAGKERAQATKPRTSAQPKSGLTFTEQHELKELEPKLEAATARVEALEAEVIAPAFFERPHNEQAAGHQALADARDALTVVEERWLELEAKKDG